MLSTEHSPKLRSRSPHMMAPGVHCELLCGGLLALLPHRFCVGRRSAFGKLGADAVVAGVVEIVKGNADDGDAHEHEDGASEGEAKVAA